MRTENRLLGPDDRHLATLVHDEVTVATMGRRADVRGWTEIDLRPAEDMPTTTTACSTASPPASARPACAPARSGPAAELDRMLRPLPRQRAGRRGSAAAVLMDYIGRQADRIAAEELRVRRDQPDAVHQMRVASRRLRSALKAYRDVLDRKRTDPIADGLRDLGGASPRPATPRCCARRIDADLAALPSELLLGPVRAEATRHFARVEAEARAAVLTALDSPEHHALRNALDDLLDRPPLNRRARRPAKKALRRPPHRPPAAPGDDRRARPRRRHSAAHRPEGREAAALRHRGDRHAQPRA